MNTSSRRPSTHAELRPWEWLYDIVGVGMWAFVRTRFDVEVIGRVPRVDDGQLWVVSHRAETDVPLIGGLLMVRGGMWRHDGRHRVHFAARDDLFEPGVVSAGLRLPRPLARLAWSLSPGPWLPRVRAHPVRRPVGVKLTQVLRDLDPGLPLEDVLSPAAIAEFRRRTTRFGRTSPVTVGQARDGANARALWQDIARADLSGEHGAAVWRAHTARTVGDVRRLVTLVHGGAPLVLFPEGSVSDDGDFGPVGAIVDLIGRRGNPAAILPVGVAYDPLRRGRTHLAVSIGEPVDSTGGAIAPRVAAGLRLATPVTVGQVVAHELTDAVSRGDRVLAIGGLRDALTDAAERAIRDARPVAAGLSSSSSRERSLDRALDALRARGCVTDAPPGALIIDLEAVRADRVVGRLAHEARAVWSDAPSPRDP